MRVVGPRSVVAPVRCRSSPKFTYGDSWLFHTRFVLGTEEFDAPRGSFVFVPRGTRHGFVPAAGARALLSIVRSGLEGFFRELGEGLAAGRPSSEIRAELARRYDSEAIPEAGHVLPPVKRRAGGRAGVRR